jgi:GAG-pre-integrase domain
MTRIPTARKLAKLSSTCLTGVVSALLKSCMCPVCPSTFCVSQLAKKGIMTSFTKVDCTLLDTDDGNCLLAETRITPGGLYVIPNAVRHASFSARALAANASPSSSQCLKPLSKEMQILWHARLGHVGFETVRRAAHTGVTVGIDLTAHMDSCNCHTCLLQNVSRRLFNGSLVKRASFW